MVESDPVRWRLVFVVEQKVHVNTLMICPVMMDERQRWQKVLWYDDDESSRWKERCLHER